ncbi:ankyrin repeat protein [Verticillium dahliae]|nr:Universal stress protein A family protein C25B2.10 [Verticillium dahliae VDG2]
MVASGGPSSAMQQLVRLGGASMVVECSSHDTEKLLHLAAVNEDPTMARYMLELGNDLNAQNTDGESPLHVAASFGTRAQVELLLDRGADTSLLTLRGRIVLHLAAAQGWLATVEWLMEIGADIFSHDNQGRTPLHTAAASMGIDSTTVVRFSVDRGLEVEDADEGGMTPLHHVLYSYDVLHKDAFDPEVSLANARYLLQRGANVNAKDLEGTTPLHLATWRGNSAVVKLLLKSGADVEARNRGDVKPIDHANKKTRFGSFSNWQQESDLVIVLSSDEYGPHIQYCNYRVF